MADEVPAPLLPDLRQRVHLRLARWAVSLPSIVEDVVAGELMLAGPLDLPDDQVPVAGERLLVIWEDVAGPHTLPCSFQSVIARELPQWRMRPDGVARDEQRRRHVRAATDGAMTVVRDQQALDGTVVDLSEGGVRCRLEDPDAVVGVGDIVSCVLRLGLKELDLSGRVVQVHLTVGEPRLLAISFDDLTASQADELRRRVFAEQARARAHSAR